MDLLHLYRLPAIIGAIFAFILLGAYVAHDAYIEERAVAQDNVSRRDREIARRDHDIKLRDAALTALQRQDSVLQQSTARLRHRYDSVAAGWTGAKTQLEADAATHGGLVPIEAVRLAERKADSTISSLVDLNRVQAARIANLETQITNQTETRVQLDSNRVASDSTRVDVVKIARPPWWKRTASWVSDHAITLGVGFVGGVVAARKL